VRKELLHEETLEEHGAFKRVRRWWKGKHANGVIIKPDQTLSGEFETREETTIIRPERKFKVL